MTNDKDNAAAAATESVFIPDGYTLSRRIKRVRGLHGSLEFAFRPLIAEERDEFRQTYKGSPSNQMNAALRALLAGQIVSWDAKDPKTGLALPVNAETVRRLHPVVYDKVYFIVCGDEPGEVIEPATPVQRSQFMQELEARANGDNRQEASQKNSG